MGPTALTLRTLVLGFVALAAVLAPARYAARTSPARYAARTSPALVLRNDGGQLPLLQRCELGT